MEDKVYAWSKLQLKIKSTLVEEPDWFNTTELSILIKYNSVATDPLPGTSPEKTISGLEAEKEKVKELL